MESIFTNEKTQDLIDMLESTKQQKTTLLDEIASCDDFIDDVEKELRKRI
jgi:uncharacterized protein YlxW (UPF0749 family)